MSSNAEQCKHLFGSNTRVGPGSGIVSISAGATIPLIPMNPDRVALIIATWAAAGIVAWINEPDLATGGIPVFSHHRLEVFARDSGMLCSHEWFARNTSENPFTLAVIEIETLRPVALNPDLALWEVI